MNIRSIIWGATVLALIGIAGLTATSDDATDAARCDDAATEVDGREACLAAAPACAQVDEDVAELVRARYRAGRFCPAESASREVP